MKIARLLPFAAILLGVQAFAPGAQAVEALSTEELLLHCELYDDDPDNRDGIFCVRYIQGFIDGAVATDERVTMNVANEVDDEEGFVERAMRTRLGSRMEQFGPSYYAEFCLGEPLELKTVVLTVIADLLDPTTSAASPLARDVVYNTLRREYPCESTETE